LEILDVRSGARLLRLQTTVEFTKAVEGENRRAVWSSDGRLLAASGSGRQICVWRAENGQLLQTLLSHSAEVISLALSPSGEVVASSSWEDTLQLSEIATGRRLATTPGAVRNLAFSRDGRWLGPGRVGNATNCIFELVRSVGFRRLAPPVPESGVKAVHTMEFSRDGSLALVAGADGVILWDCLTGRFLGVVPIAEACWAAFDRDGSALLISAEGELSRWPLHFQSKQGDRELRIGPGEKFGPEGKNWAFAALEPQSGRLAIASWANPAVILNLRDPTDWVQLEQVHTNGINIDLSPDGTFVATGAWQGKNVRISDARSGKLLHEHSTSTHATVAFSPDGVWLIVAGDQYQALPVGTWTNWQTIQPSEGGHRVGATAFSPDGKLLAVFRTSTSYELIEPGTWRTLAVLQSPYPLSLGRPRFSRDGTLLAMPDTGQGVQIWDLHTLRAALRPMGLDWNHPENSPASSNTATQTIAVEVLTR
jgi:WD40 repeat protein